MIYKVSYVIAGGGHPGAMINQNHAPEIGKLVELGHEMYRIVEVAELLPPMGNFAYLHVICRPVEKTAEDEAGAGAESAKEDTAAGES
jgi:hypothetical protein